MPIATPEVYAAMLDKAKENAFAYPAINVSSSQTLNAALQGFAEAGSDGIVQVSTGGGEYASGPTIKNMVTGAVALAAYAHEVAKNYPINIALHTDHCPKDKLDELRPAAARDLRRAGGAAARSRCSSPTCGTARPCRWRRTSPSPTSCWPRPARPRSSSRSRSGSSAVRRTASATRSTRSSTPRSTTACAPSRCSAPARRAATSPPSRSATCTGSTSPAPVKLRPEVLKDIQEQVGAKIGKERPFDLVFHGGSGSTLEEIRAAVDFGVVKMNVDTDTQYAFTRPAAAHMFTNYDGVLKVDGEVGNKKAYDPRAWGKLAEAGMAAARRDRLRGSSQHRHIAQRLTSPSTGSPCLRGEPGLVTADTPCRAPRFLVQSDSLRRAARGICGDPGNTEHV